VRRTLALALPKDTGPCARQRKCQWVSGTAIAPAGPRERPLHPPKVLVLFQGRRPWCSSGTPPPSPRRGTGSGPGAYRPSKTRCRRIWEVSWSRLRPAEDPST
jgi:hypothetical protein